MSEGTILVVEDEVDISNMLRICFEGQGCEVWVAARGQDALDMCHRQLPDVIILDIMLPDIDGYEVCRRLQDSLRTSHIPIIFLTQLDDRSDKIAGLELGAYDYVTKPFDLEEIKWRVQNALRRTTYKSLTDPITGLPSGRLITEQLRQLVKREDWTMFYIGINGFGSFKEEQGFMAGEKVLRFVAMLLTEAVDEIGTSNDFIGHVGDDDFILVTSTEKAPALHQRLIERFAARVDTLGLLQGQGKDSTATQESDGPESKAPLMSLAIGVVPEGAFVDVREITEAAAIARRDAMRHDSHPMEQP